jgi:hypothetical protein
LPVPIIKNINNGEIMINNCQQVELTRKEIIAVIVVAVIGCFS